jgi:hypothetical protein
MPKIGSNQDILNKKLASIYNLNSCNSDLFPTSILRTHSSLLAYVNNHYDKTKKKTKSKQPNCKETKLQTLSTTTAALSASVHYLKRPLRKQNTTTYLSINKKPSKVVKSFKHTKSETFETLMGKTECNLFKKSISISSINKKHGAGDANLKEISKTWTIVQFDETVFNVPSVTTSQNLVNFDSQNFKDHTEEDSELHQDNEIQLPIEQKVSKTEIETINSRKIITKSKSYPQIIVNNSLYLNKRINSMLSLSLIPFRNEFFMKSDDIFEEHHSVELIQDFYYVEIIYFCLMQSLNCVVISRFGYNNESFSIFSDVTIDLNDDIIKNAIEFNYENKQVPDKKKKCIEESKVFKLSHNLIKCLYKLGKSIK